MVCAEAATLPGVAQQGVQIKEHKWRGGSEQTLLHPLVPRDWCLASMYSVRMSLLTLILVKQTQHVYSVLYCTWFSDVMLSMPAPELAKLTPYLVFRG